MSDEVLRFLLKAVKSGDLEVEDAVRLVRTAAGQNEPAVLKPSEYLVWKPLPGWEPNTTPTWTNF